MYTFIWAVMSQGLLPSISKSIFILCCTDLRKWIQTFRGRRTDSQIALSWGVAWSVRFQTAFASHWSTGSLPWSYFPLKNILGFAAVICDALYGRCNAVCNLESCELCIPWTVMVHLQTGRSTELFINSKFIFCPLRKAFLPQVWDTKFQRNSFGNLTLLKIQNYFATFLKHCIRVDPLAVLNLLAVFFWERFLSSSPPLPFWLEAVIFILFVDLCSYSNFLFWFPQQHILENELICPFCRFKFGVES